MALIQSSRIQQLELGYHQNHQNLKYASNVHPAIESLQKKSSQLVVGIQGGVGSNNHIVFHQLTKKYALNAVPDFLGSTEPVLQALEDEKIDAGIFAIRTSNAGEVEMTERALEKFTCQAIDIHILKIRHNLFSICDLDPEEYTEVWSHPQALKEQFSYLNDYPNLVQWSESDTSRAACKLSNGDYGKTALVIAPYICSQIYQNLITLKENLPPDNYKTTFAFVVKGDN